VRRRRSSAARERTLPHALFLEGLGDLPDEELDHIAALLLRWHGSARTLSAQPSDWGLMGIECSAARRGGQAREGPVRARRAAEVWHDGAHLHGRLHAHRVRGGLATRRPMRALALTKEPMFAHPLRVCKSARETREGL
jgi:hypothetical protein